MRRTLITGMDKGVAGLAEETGKEK